MGELCSKLYICDVSYGFSLLYFEINQLDQFAELSLGSYCV